MSVAVWVGIIALAGLDAETGVVMLLYLDHAWEKFDLRKNPLTPWLKPYMIDYISNFETVLNGFYPTISDYKISSLQRKAVKLLSGPRYRAGIYALPYEIKAIQKFWLKYRQPEWEGF